MQRLTRWVVSWSCLVFLPPALVLAQGSVDGSGQGSGQGAGKGAGKDVGEVYGAWSPTPEHRDARHGHNHVYPDRGAVFREAPRGAVIVNYAGLAYRFYNGVWFEPRGPAFMVVVPPIGLVVPTMPESASTVVANGESYRYANETYYQLRPDLGGYEVVNAPTDVAPPGTTTATAPASVSLTSYAPAAPSRVPGMALYTYPRNGQSADQQARDRYECHRFAVTQTGYDPLRAGGATTPAASDERRSDYQRAQTACFEGLGYTVR